ncbi:tRNA pseudouridine(55) synthase TruB [Fluviicola sp.]|jgi:tRNA pseudouridine55 synthase|uniref:tRNA pseudouridine(55) synthase TruB n=1 Tax=Fluviicola sp. TaxID=1917219 RepID=UPI0028194F7C|nr:tRNA pseudouridine(55) synthase TruB [Fluviicola sp.]MDR0801270.1 tRNA pseudouridine(55) synthase TruB [Fluviicola sp.]
MITEFAKGSTILVDKPFEWTSFDAVNKLRWHLKKRLGVKKLKVGHAGTLDPLATGLLVICIGKHTKLIEGLTADAKTYTGTFLLGKTTPSYDLETTYNSDKPTGTISAEQMEEVRLSFLGTQQQVPPLFSAKQIDGKRAYNYARAGIEKELKSNTIEITDFKIDASRFPEIDFEISCSKGTYIRSIAHDFGQKLGCGATLIALRRTQSGVYDVKDSRSVDEWIAFIEEQPL